MGKYFITTHHTNRRGNRMENFVNPNFNYTEFGTINNPGFNYGEFATIGNSIQNSKTSNLRG
jgi:hypothetical protein